MKLFILGATGGIGSAMVEQALLRGHAVTAFVRSPDKVRQRNPRLLVVPGDPRSVEELTAALPGHEAVLSALGPPGLGRTTIIRESARSMVTAMQATGVRRLLMVSAAMLFRDAGILAAVLRQTLLRNVAEDCAEMEQAVTGSGLDWVIMRPPRLTNGQLTTRYRIEEGHLPRAGMIVSRADVAHFLLEAAQNGSHLRTIVGMAQ